MNKKVLVISLVLLVIVIGLLCIIVNNRNDDTINISENETNSEAENKDIPSLENNIKEQEKEEGSKVEEIYIKVNNNILNVKLEDNDSTKKLVEKLKENDITIEAREYGEFEKVGDLGFELPRDDKNIKTDAGDIVLYQGNQISVFYGSNSWSYTKLGKIQNLSKSELKKILGDGNVRLTFSIDK